MWSAIVTTLLLSVTLASGQVVAPAADPEEKLYVANMTLNCDSKNEGRGYYCSKSIPLPFFDSNTANITVEHMKLDALEVPHEGWNFSLILNCANETAKEGLMLCYDLPREHSSTCLSETVHFDCPLENVTTWTIDIEAALDRNVTNATVEIEGLLYTCASMSCAMHFTPHPPVPPTPTNAPPSSPEGTIWPIYLVCTMAAVFCICTATWIVRTNNGRARQLPKANVRERELAPPQQGNYQRVNGDTHEKDDEGL
eukprot:Sspe_Gene.38551::Locus_18581_Transcript_2_2_Confidence_0.833_Length_954::g.38551::m.38551